MSNLLTVDQRLDLIVVLLGRLVRNASAYLHSVDIEALMAPLDRLVVDRDLRRQLAQSDVADARLNGSGEP